MTAPYTEFLRSLKPTDSEAERLAKLLRAYGIHKQRDGFVAVRKGRDREEADDEERGQAGDDGGESDDDTEVAASKHLLSTVADLLVEGGGAPDRKSALYHLMHTPRGAELVRRLKRQKEQTPVTYNRSEELTSIIKQFGPVALAKHLVENGPCGLSEHEFTAMVDAYAKANGTTFVKLYTAQDSDGLAIRRATQILKGFGTAGPVREAVAGGSAYEALMAKADELRKREPQLSREQSFLKAFQDPVNRELAARERSENRPVA
jgi:hypothetical protein